MRRHFSFAIALCALLFASWGSAHTAQGDATVGTNKSPLPARKAGLWEMTVRSDELSLKRRGQGPQRPQTLYQCTSSAAEPVMLLAILPGQEVCSKVEARQHNKNAGGGYEIETVCEVHGNRVDAKMQIAGDLQSVYTGSFDVRYPAIPLQNTGRMVFQGRWMGACSAGQRPGDMVLPNGVTVNVADDQRRAREAAARGGHKH